jgi:hypothetical protein
MPTVQSPPQPRNWRQGRTRGEEKDPNFPDAFANVTFTPNPVQWGATSSSNIGRADRFYCDKDKGFVRSFFGGGACNRCSGFGASATGGR